MSGKEEPDILVPFFLSGKEYIGRVEVIKNEARQDVSYIEGTSPEIREVFKRMNDFIHSYFPLPSPIGRQIAIYYDDEEKRPRLLRGNLLTKTESPSLLFGVFVALFKALTERALGDRWASVTITGDIDFIHDRLSPRTVERIPDKIECLKKYLCADKKTGRHYFIYVAPEPIIASEEIPVDQDCTIIARHYKPQALNLIDFMETILRTESVKGKNSEFVYISYPFYQLRHDLHFSKNISSFYISGPWGSGKKTLLAHAAGNYLSAEINPLILERTNAGLGPFKSTCDYVQHLVSKSIDDRDPSDAVPAIHLDLTDIKCVKDILEIISAVSSCRNVGMRKFFMTSSIHLIDMEISFIKGVKIIDMNTAFSESFLDDVIHDELRSRCACDVDVATCIRSAVPRITGNSFTGIRQYCGIAASCYNECRGVSMEQMTHIYSDDEKRTLLAGLTAEEQKALIGIIDNLDAEGKYIAKKGGHGKISDRALISLEKQGFITASVADNEVKYEVREFVHALTPFLSELAFENEYISGKTDYFAAFTVDVRFKDIARKYFSCDYEKIESEKVSFTDEDALSLMPEGGDKSKWMETFRAFLEDLEYYERTGWQVLNFNNYAPFILVEHYFYFKMLAVYCKEKKDPFSRIKEASLDDTELVNKILDICDEQNRDLIINQCVFYSLWGNTSDMSQAPMHQSFKNPMIIMDDTYELTKFLKVRKSLEQVDFIIDNSGPEFISDLVFALILLETGYAKTVILRVKVLPVFVSDVIASQFGDDIAATLAFIKAHRPQVHERLVGMIESKRLMWASDPFWNMPYDFRNHYATFREIIGNSSLVVVKGDLNYRRLVEDRASDHSISLKTAISYMTYPCLVIRTLKSSVIYGLSKAEEKDLFKDDPKWLINGKRGLIQFVDVKKDRF
jgi:hypothetical protein